MYKLLIAFALVTALEANLIFDCSASTCNVYGYKYVTPCIQEIQKWPILQSFDPSEYRINHDAIQNPYYYYKKSELAPSIYNITHNSLSNCSCPLTAEYSFSDLNGVDISSYNMPPQTLNCKCEPIIHTSIIKYKTSDVNDYQFGVTNNNDDDEDYFSNEIIDNTFGSKTMIKTSQAHTKSVQTSHDYRCSSASTIDIFNPKVLCVGLIIYYVFRI